MDETALASAALQSASPVLEQQISQTIASEQALQPGTPMGEAAIALEQSLASGASPSQTAVNVARAAGAAAGTVCGPGAPLCSTMFAYTAGEMTKFIQGVRSGDIAFGAGRRSPNSMEAEQARCDLATEVSNSLGDLIGKARAEYVKLFNRYITRAQVKEHMRQAAATAGYDLDRATLPWCIMYPGTYQEFVSQLEMWQRVWSTAYMRTIAAYGHLAAQQADQKQQQIYRSSIKGSVKRAAEAARGMAKSYGEAMRRNAQLLKEAGYSYDERSALMKAGGARLRDALDQAETKIRIERYEAKQRSFWWTMAQATGGVLLLAGGAVLVWKAKS
jgi:hypothetical protein